MTYALHTATATAGGTPLQVINAELQLDDTWSPYLRGSLQVVTPTDPALLDPRDPDTVLEVTAAVQYGPEMQWVSDLTAEWAGGTKTTADMTVLFGGDLTSDVLAGYDRAWDGPYLEPSQRTVRARPRRRLVESGGITTLQLATDEALLHDLRCLIGGGLYPSTGSTLRDVIRELFADLTAQTAYTFTLADGPADMTLPEIQLSSGGPMYRLAQTKTGQTWWDFLTPFLQVSDLRLWCDPATGLFRLTENDAPSTARTAVFSTGNGGNVLKAWEEIDKDADLWGDAAVIDYQANPADAGALHTSVAVDLDYTKVLYLEVDAISPINQFTAEPDTAAYLMYQRAKRRGRTVPVNALSDYAVEPGCTATLDIPLSVPLTGTVQAVTWRIPEWEMTVTTRDLEETP